MQHRHWAFAISAIFVLTACSQSNDAQSETAESTAPAATGSAVAAPALGVDLSALNPAIKPGDDFFMYANGTWYDNAEIPADRAGVGTFLTVYKRTQQRITRIIEQAAASNPAPGTEAAKIADYYAAYM